MDNAEQIREIKFEGMLDRLREDALAPHFVASIRYHQYDPTVLDVELLWLGAGGRHRVGAQASSYLLRLHPWLHSNDPNVPPIELQGVQAISERDNHTAIDVTGINVGLTENALQEDLPLVVIVELQPSGILGIPRTELMSYTGEVTLDKMISGEVSVETSLGTLQAMERYEYYSSDAFGDRVRHRIQRASITGRILIPAHTCMLAAHETLQHQLDDICLALSLCYRQPVDYYEIRYIPVPQAEAERRRPSLLSRRKWLQHATKRRAEELINIRALVDGGLQKLVMSIRECSESASVARAIRFLSASYEASLETYLFNNPWHG